MSSRPLVIRPYAPDDLDATIGIFLRAIRETASVDYTLAQVNAWAQADRESWTKRRRGRATWVALVNNTPAGFAELEPDGHIDMMFVHPSFGGTGVAGALLETIEQAAMRQGSLRLFTEASITARGFFERRGFRTIAAQRIPCRGETLTNFRMEKLIQAAGR
ncbi:GNAT family N-acetyltransferase [Aquibaculum sediminis]|uniref:GNAT family N-acetyltransferase n=1 Tax=Aquibaculum sediminis TaxID=3231907 RepID=UPI003452F521